MRRKANISIFVPHNGCPNACIFCNQHTISGWAETPTPQQITQLCAQSFQRLDQRYTHVEIAFFGGSFTAIPRDMMISMLEAAYPFVQSGQAAGIRLSTRPDAIDQEVLQVLRRYGVTAIELGVQSMDEQVLCANRRGHTPQETQTASRLIREGGFELGHQMMTGLYTDTQQGCRETAQQILAMAPDTVRIYPTVVLEGTRLAELWRTGEYTSPTLEESVTLCADLLRQFTAGGVRVIRMGLQASDEVERQMLAGVYHPAFRELCESRIMLTDMKMKLSGRPTGNYALWIAQGARSKAVGQHRCNIQAMEQLGYHLTIRETDRLESLELELELE